MAVNQKLEYRLSFSADTSKAKAQIKDLNNQLNQLANTALNRNDLDYSGQIGKSIKSINQLQTALQQATNVNTGKLDLSKFNDSLNKSGLKLKDVQQNLSALGPKGKQAFLSLTQSIVTADASLVKTSKLVQELKTSLSNTIKWQLSSSAVHAFMGAIQGAFGYAKDLNKSLNDIRIVTGQSADQMADFAKQANNAAKALSTSTVKYAEAALIYYQQGLNDEQVKARTDTTIKMANVTGENAANVSSYMTAIWNNFAEGSSNLEYFGDVITALGAATAASSEEIAGGLEKFAAVGETVGLSYEYATAALTTIIDKTRQSEDVVGTALKTIFARIQGLQQGETAEDGVTLNKYSSALANVGIQIMDTSGNLKEMDQILDELGQKWQTLSKAEQVALAQTVGGTRQYTQLIALMENWDAMQTNLNTAYNSTGTLQEQADIYAESWEAAQARVTAALQDIYDSLLNDEFFIDLTNIFADLLEFIGNFIDSLGGMKGAISLLGTLLMTIFDKELKSTFTMVGSWINKITGKSKTDIEGLRKEAISLSRQIASSMGQDTQAGVLSRTADLYDEIAKKINNLTDEQKKELENALEINRVLREKVLLKDQELKSEEKNLHNQKMNIMPHLNEDQTESVNTLLDDAKLKGEVQGIVQHLSQNKQNFDINQKDFQQQVDNFYQGYLNELKEKGGPFAEKASESINKAMNALKVEGLTPAQIKKIQEELDNDLDQINNSLDLDAVKVGQKLIATFGPELGDKIYQAYKTALNVGGAQAEKEFAVRAEQLANNQIKSTLQSWGKVVSDFGSQAMASVKVLTSFTTVVNTVKGSLETLKDPELSGWEKFTSVIAAASSVIMALKFAFDAQTVSQLNAMGSSIGLTAALILEKLGFKAASEAAFEYSTAMSAATGASAGLLIPILAIVAAVALVVGACILIYNWINKDAIALKKANEELRKTKEAAEDASSAYNDLKSSIDSLKSAQDTLAGLEEGTLKWKEAVLEVNEQVLALIEKYPQLAEYMSSEKGILGISEEGLNKVVETQLKEAKALQETVLSDARNVKEQELKNNAPEWNNIGYKEITGYEFKTDSNTHETYSEAISEDKIITANEQAKIIEKALEKDAIKNGTIDWSKMGEEYNSASNEFKLAIDQSVRSLLDLYHGAQQAGEQLKALDRTKAETWINNHTGLNEGLAGPIAEEMAEIINSVNFQDTKTTIENEVKKASQAEVVKGYAQTILGENAEESELNEYIKQLNQDIKDKKLDVDTLKEYLANNAINYAAFNEAIKDPNAIVAKANEKKEMTDEEFDAKVSQTASGLKVDEDALQSYISYLQSTNKELENNREAALAAAEANLKFSQGAEKVSKAFSDHEDALKSADESAWEYHEAIAAVHEATIEMLGIEVDTNYVKEHLDDIKKAAEGDEKALTKLQQTAAVNWAESFVDQVQSVEKVVNEAGDVLVEAFNAEDWKNSFLDVIDDVANNLGELDTSFTLDANTQPALDELVKLTNEALRAGQMTQAEMEAMFASMGYSPEVTWTTVPAPDTHTITDGTIKWGNFELGEIHSDLTHHNEVAVPQIGDKDKNGISFTKINGSTKTKASSAKKSSSKGSGSLKDNKSSKDEIERYHKIKEVIEDLNRELDTLGKEKDRAFGKNKLKLMDKEIAKLRDMEAAQKQYNKEIEEYYNKDKDAIAKYGAKFDENGILLNYEELIQEQVDKFNKLRTDKDEEEYQKFMDTLKQYEETHDLLEEEKEKLVDIQNQIYDAALEKIDYKVDLQIEINSDDLEFLEFLLENLTDAAYDAADAIANLGQQTAEQLQNQEIYTQGINDIFAGHGLGNNATDQFLNGSLGINDLADMNFTEKEVEILREYRDGLIETTKELIKLREETWNKVIEAVTALGEEFDEQSERVDHAIEVMDSYRNIIDIVGKDALGISDDMMKVFAETAVNSATDALIVSKAKFDTLKAQYEETQKAYESATEAEKEQLEKVLNTITNEMRDAENEMLSDWENALEKANELFEENTKRILENFKNAMAGHFESLETLQDDFAKTRELDDMYIDDYKKIYELSKLTRDINRSMDETDNLAAKNALRDIQKEINDLQEAGVELSEYDLDYLRAKYELRLAEIALEDAQNAKNQVRMTRDSEGNWSYTYTADQDNIDNAQQKYEDKLYAIQELSTNYIKDLEEQIIDLSANLAEEIAAIDRTVYASEEAYNAEVERITNFYQQKMDILGQQMNNALNNNNEIYTQDWTNYSNATGYKISADEKFLSSFNETTLGIKTGFETMQSYQQAFNKAIGKPGEIGTLLGDLSKAYNDWKDRVDEVMKAAGTSMDNFKNVAEQAAKDTKEETDKAADSMENLKKKTEDAYKAALKAAQDFEKAYGPEIQKIIDKNKNLVTSLNSIIGKWGEIKTAADNATTAAKNYNQYASNSGTAAGGGSSGGGGSKVETSKTPTSPVNTPETWGEWKKTGAKKYDNGATLVQFYRTSNKGKTEYKWSQEYVKTGARNSNGYYQYQSTYDNSYKWVREDKGQVAYFDTGGYTGEWGSSGRLAMLHEKELVLNADDTKNMFSVVNAVRDIAKSIDLNANVGLGLGNLISAMIPSSESNLNQNIEIRAEFPYATDRNEIEAAFDNLINRASQYVNRKVK